MLVQHWRDEGISSVYCTHRVITATRELYGITEALGYLEREVGFMSAENGVRLIPPGIWVHRRVPGTAKRLWTQKLSFRDNREEREWKSKLRVGFSPCDVCKT